MPNLPTSEKNNQQLAGSAKRSAQPGLKQISLRAIEEIEDLTGYECSSVVSMKGEGEQWKVMMELVEKRGIPDRMDILGLYEVIMSVSGDLLKYERRGLRKRGDTAQPEESE
jgi:hypothetical protein